MKKISKNTYRLIQLLSEQRFTSGSQLGLALNVTRAAVWKMIRQLQQRGIEIESDRSCGYRLTHPLVLLNKQHIQQYLNPAQNTPYIDIFDSIDSTNTYLLSNISPNKKGISFCLSEEQTDGNGRHSRTWYSPYAKNIYLSATFSLPYDPLSLGTLIHHISISIIQTLNAFGLCDRLMIKWPNDILWDDMKLAGTLVQSIFESNGYCALVLGIGININSSTKELLALKEPATSAQIILERYIDRNPIVAKLINQLTECYQLFASQPTIGIPSDWQHYDYLANKRIKLQCGEKTFEGIARGINNFGHLRLQTEDNCEQVFSAGDTALIRKQDS